MIVSSNEEIAIQTKRTHRAPNQYLKHPSEAQTHSLLKGYFYSLGSKNISRLPFTLSSVFSFPYVTLLICIRHPQPKTPTVFQERLTKKKRKS